MNRIPRAGNGDAALNSDPVQRLWTRMPAWRRVRRRRFCRATTWSGARPHDGVMRTLLHTNISLVYR